MTALLDEITDDNTLAFLMGHEMSHALCRHTGESLSDGAVISVAANFVMTAVLMIIPFDVNFLVDWIASGLILNGGLGRFGGLESTAVKAFSRVHETEADYVGGILAARACYDPRRFGHLFHVLSEASNLMSAEESDALSPGINPRSLWAKRCCPSCSGEYSNLRDKRVFSRKAKASGSAEKPAPFEEQQYRVRSDEPLEGYNKQIEYGGPHTMGMFAVRGKWSADEFEKLYRQTLQHEAAQEKQAGGVKKGHQDKGNEWNSTHPSNERRVAAASANSRIEELMRESRACRCASGCGFFRERTMSDKAVADASEAAVEAARLKSRIATDHTVKATAREQAAALALEAEWHESWDSKRGRTFFWNKRTNQRRWDPPPGWTHRQQGSLERSVSTGAPGIGPMPAMKRAAPYGKV